MGDWYIPRYRRISDSIPSEISADGLFDGRLLSCKGTGKSKSECLSRRGCRICGNSLLKESGPGCSLSLKSVARSWSVTIGQPTNKLVKLLDGLARVRCQHTILLAPIVIPITALGSELLELF